SQQIYISDQAWQMIKLSREEVLQVIDKSYLEMVDDSKAINLGKAMLTNLSKSKSNLAGATIAFLKKELDLVF
ncbi:MAG: hypothetical protein ACI9UJ_002515, partial [bacterium]